MASPARFKVSSFAIQWSFVTGVLAGTYNTSGYSFYHWVAADPSTQLPWKILVGLLILLVYLFTFEMVWRSLRFSGLVLSGGFFVVLTWALATLEIVVPTPTLVVLWLQFGVAAIVAAGLSYSPFRQQVSGQVTSSSDGGK